ncbi:MAG: NAD+ synthase [Magnetococcales bacterium]|nr:NAD+ synthase [Magnetococcales bacterium]
MKITLLQTNPTVGDLTGNSNTMLRHIDRFGESNDLLVFPELAITGYYPMDLLQRPGFIDEQDVQLRRLQQATQGVRAAVVLGCVIRNDGPGKPWFNSLVVLKDGQRLFTYHKRLLPTYDVFDEARHFEPGTESRPWSYDGVRIGFLICEDGWNDDADSESRDENVPTSPYQVNPVAELNRQGVDLFISLNASPSNLGKLNQRLEIFSRLARRYSTPYIYLNQVGGNDEIVFDGSSFVLDRHGETTLFLPPFERGHATLELVTDKKGVQPVPTEVVDEAESSPFPRQNVTNGAKSDSSDPLRFRPSWWNRDAAFTDGLLLYRQITRGLRDYMQKCGFQKVVVGSSGGIDSAVTLALAQAALGSERVTAITLPSRHSSRGSVDDSETLCATLGIRLHHVSIEQEYALAVTRFTESFGEPPSRITQENIQARIRGRILMEYANHFGALLLSTGNKSELSVGYATLYGDMNGGLNLLGDLYKTEVTALARFLNRYHSREQVPEAIISKPPSAELSPDQQDSDTLPPYPVLDAILRLFIEQDLLTQGEIARNRALLHSSGISQQEVQRILSMVDGAEFKRRQAPPVIRVHRRAFGIGRRVPIAQRFRKNACPLLNDQQRDCIHQEHAA